MPSHPETPESLAKKRARDRRAQQNLRDKRIAHVEALERRIIALDGELQSMRQICTGLRRENEVLRGRQEHVHRIVSSWTRHTSPQRDSGNSTINPVLESVEASSPFNTIRPEQGVEDDRDTTSTHSVRRRFSTASSVAPTVHALRPSSSPSREPTQPQWSLIPVHIDSSPFVTDLFDLAFGNPELVRACPETPQPVDFLYGSKNNYLANIIHEATRRWPCRDPERLAAGWLAYHQIKWMLEPSEERFSRLHDFQRPVPEQLRYPHAFFADFIIWPRLRANLIKNQHTYDRQDMVGMLTCCLKVRWPWNKPFLQPTDEGQLVIQPDFYNTFTKPEGWGLTREFLNRYPALIDGLDTTSIHYEVC
ncbi:hypothetical protein F5Y05DRAFT_274866 [Hypoxylon sp. FL0543]|nr:hypothetical protein F5Y05DRAFT_274866 [Hypoxylon sp. FL0543]